MEIAGKSMLGIGLVVILIACIAAYNMHGNMADDADRAHQAGDVYASLPDNEFAEQSYTAAQQVYTADKTLLAVVVGVIALGGVLIGGLGVVTIAVALGNDNTAAIEQRWGAVRDADEGA